MSVYYAYAGGRNVQLYGPRSDMIAAGCPKEWFDNCLRRPEQKWGKARVPREVHRMPHYCQAEAKLVRSTDRAAIVFTVEDEKYIIGQLPEWARKVIKAQIAESEERAHKRLLATVNEYCAVTFSLREPFFVKFMDCVLTGNAQHLRDGPRRSEAA